MKFRQPPRDDTRSATIVQTLWLILGCSAALGLTAYASDPGWWSSRGAVNSSLGTNDYAVVNQGQLKQFTARAVDELNTNLTGWGAGTNLNSMVANWSNDYYTNGYNASNPKPADYTVMQVGQLKYVGNLIWIQLQTAGYTNAMPAWLDLNTNTDTQVAAIGQLKTVFNFDTSSFSSMPHMTSSNSANATVGTAFSYTVTASNSPTSFGIIGSSLPAGLTLNTSTGVISGTPTVAGGTYLVQLSLTNASGTTYGTLSLTVPAVAEVLTIGTGSNNQTVAASSFAANALVAHVTTSSGTALSNAAVTFSISTPSDGGLTLTSGGTTTTSVNATTDASGNATVYYQAGPDALKNNIVTATATSSSNSASVNFTIDCGIQSGLAMWLKADAGVTTTGTAVSSWTDQTGNHTVTQSTGNKQPSYVASDINGEPGLRFSGTECLANTGTVSANADMTMIFVGSTSNPTTSQEYAIYLGNGATGTSRGLGYSAQKEIFDFARSPSVPGAAVPGANVFVFQTATVNPSLSTATIYRNGVQTTSASISGALNVTSGIFISTYNGTNSPWQGDISEVIVYNRQLTSTELGQVSGYIADKYGLYNPNATWPLAYSSAVQTEITLNQWTKAQADAYVAFEAANPSVLTTGLVVWLKADAGVTTSGTMVTAWADQTSNNYLPATQTTNAAQPTYVANDFDGMPGLRFNDAQSLASASSLGAGLNNDFTIVTVDRTYGPSNAQDVIDVGGSGTSQSRGFGYGTGKQMLDENGAQAFGGLTANVNTYVADMITVDASRNVTFYRNATQTATTTLSAENALSSGFHVGCRSDGTQLFDGDISEILVYNHKLSSSEQTQVYTYLVNKYGFYMSGAAWIASYSSAIQAEINRNQWTKAQADAYVAFQAANPTMLTNGLAMWLKADSGVTLTGTGVSSWTDQTGSYIVSQINAAQRPLYVTGDLNGVPGVRFSGIECLNNPGQISSGLNNDMTMIFVGATSTPTASQQYAIYLGNGTTGTNRGLGYSSQKQYLDFHTPTVSGTAVPAANTFVTEMATISSSLTSASQYRNGVVTHTATISGALNITNGIYISTYNGGNSTWLGDINEVLVYDHQLSSAEQSQVGEYLGDKYLIYNPSANWILAYSSAVQALIASGQWNKAQADAYVNSQVVTEAIVSGNNQTAPFNTFAANPLVVQVKDGLGNLVVNAQVSFAIASGSSGGLASSGGGSTSSTLAVQTNASGNAQVYYQTANASGTNSVTASVATKSVTFTEISANPVATPTFSPGAGTYTLAQTVTLSSATSGATIYYTTDGTSPTTSSPSISSGGVVTVSQNETVKAMATASGSTASTIASAAYVIQVPATTSTFSPGTGTYTSAQVVTLTSISGSTIYYTIDGSSPLLSSLSVASGDSIIVNQSETVNAMAVATGYNNSAVASASYVIQVPAATPTFSVSAGTYASVQTVTLTSTSGATIYYTTDGTTPTTSSPSVTSGGTITVSQSETVAAIAVASGYNNSAVASAAYVIQVPAATPTFSPGTGTYTSAQIVTLTSTTGGTIYYTTDGTSPLLSSSSVASGGSIMVDQSETVMAIAVASGYANSATASAAYTFPVPAAAPSFSPSGGGFTTSQTVILSSTTPGATIYYTMDGTPPTINSASVASGGTITVDQSETINAMTSASGYDYSPASTASYAISSGLVAAPGGAGEIDLSWNLPYQSSASTILLEQSTDGGTTWTTVATVPASTNTYSTTGLDSGSSYVFRATAQDSSGSTLSSADTTTSPQMPPVPPPSYAVIDLGANVAPWALSNADWVALHNPSGQTGRWHNGIPETAPTATGAQFNIGIDDYGTLAGSETPATTGTSSNSIPCVWLANASVATPLNNSDIAEDGNIPDTQKQVEAIDYNGTIYGSDTESTYPVATGVSSNTPPYYTLQGGIKWANASAAPAAQGNFTIQDTQDVYDEVQVGNTETVFRAKGGHTLGYMVDWVANRDSSGKLYTGSIYTWLGASVDQVPVTYTPIDISTANWVLGQSGSSYFVVGGPTPETIPNATSLYYINHSTRNLNNPNGTTTPVESPQILGINSTNNQTLYQKNPNTNKYEATAVGSLVSSSSGWSGIGASQINDYGVMIGTGTYTPTGTTDPIAAGSHGVLLFPVLLEIDGVPDQYKKAIGGLIVQNDLASSANYHQANNAPRQKIEIYARPNVGNVILTKTDTNNCIKIFDAATAGNLIAFDGTANVFPSSSFVNGEKDLYVEGEAASKNMQDVKLMLAMQSMPNITDTASFTVLWVDQPSSAQNVMSFGVNAPITVPSSTAAEQIFASYCVSGVHLGPVQFDVDSGASVGWATQATVKVSPANFNYQIPLLVPYSLHMDRDVGAAAFVTAPNGTTTPVSGVPSMPSPLVSLTTDALQGGNDTSNSTVSNTPDANGFLYDLDCPGQLTRNPSTQTLPLGVINRVRANFIEFADIKINHQWIRCSPFWSYDVTFSQQQTTSPAGWTWTLTNPPDVTGDNQANLGSLAHLTWNLQ